MAASASVASRISSRVWVALTQQLLARRGKLHLPPELLEQRQSDFVLEQPDLLLRRPAVSGGNSRAARGSRVSVHENGRATAANTLICLNVTLRMPMSHGVIRQKNASSRCIRKSYAQANNI